MAGLWQHAGLPESGRALMQWPDPAHNPSPVLDAGKTVEMMALFLANPPPWRALLADGGAAPSSQLEAPPAKNSEAGEPATASADSGGESSSPAAAGPRSSGTNGQPPRGGTLVVCPPALLQQWQAELSNHAHGALVVEIYDGLRGLSGAVQEEGSSKRRAKPAQREMELYARLLAGEQVEASFDAEAEAASALRRLQHSDVVLTSFDVLRAEVGGEGGIGELLVLGMPAEPSGLRPGCPNGASSVHPGCFYIKTHPLHPPSLSHICRCTLFPTPAPCATPSVTRCRTARCCRRA